MNGFPMPNISGVTPETKEAFLERYWGALERGQKAGGPAKRKFPVEDWLKSDPALAYQARLMGLRPGLRDFFGSQLGKYYNRFQGELAAEARGTREAPTRTFSEFLQPLDFQREYMGYSPYSRGFNMSRARPPARWLNW